MKKYWDESQQFEQPSGELLKKNAGASIEKQRKKGKEVHPIIVKGRKITKTWWGNAWCENLERVKAGTRKTLCPNGNGCGSSDKEGENRSKSTGETKNPIQGGDTDQSAQSGTLSEYH